MPTFILICTDKADALDLRAATRPAHLDYVRTQPRKVVMAGPMLDDEGQPAGSVILLEAADKAEAEAFSAGDPYTTAGVFGDVVIRPFNVVIGKFA